MNGLKTGARSRRSIAGITLLICVGSLLVASSAATASATNGKRGRRTVLKDVALPFQRLIRLDASTEVVRVAVAGEGTSISMKHAKTMRPRCYTASATSWDDNRTKVGPVYIGTSVPGRLSCSGLTALDPPGTKWMLSIGGTGRADVTIDYGTRVPGPTGDLNLGRLSMRRYRMGPTKDVMIKSFDGTELHAQITRPKTDRKLPAILISSPYNVDQPSVYNPDLVADWGSRGYAIVIADVRGYNQSGGCVEVWGANEQRDQRSLIEWIARQPWSNGRVGMFGKSYVGTTPLEAAVQAPRALKAIAVVAPVVSAYRDWHFGGVPNGENSASPLSYQAVYGTSPEPGTGDVLSSAINAANGLCDPTLAARASDPRSIYDDFYKERDFGAKAEKIKAAVLYTHGYVDTNVKASVYTEFFNDLRVPHLGLFGHWAHDYPPRPDTEVLFLAWMDQYVKGIDIGLERMPNALVLDNQGRESRLPSWPPRKPRRITLYGNPRTGKLIDRASNDSSEVVLESIGVERVAEAKNVLVFKHDVGRSFEVAGIPRIRLRGTLAGAHNGHVAAFLYDGARSRKNLITFGMANLAHRKGHHRYEPATPTEVLKMNLEFIPTDYLFEPGDKLTLEIRGAHVDDWAAVSPTEPGVLSLLGGAKGTALELPVQR